MFYLPIHVYALMHILDKYITSVQFRLAYCAGQKKKIILTSNYPLYYAEEVCVCVCRPL